MQYGTDVESFLEPVYLNEKMVLNCAAYIFKGYSLESETTSQTQTEGSKSIKAGFEFLTQLISLGGEAQSKQAQSTENRSARRYTVGGLHMSLIDELHNRTMLQAIAPDSLDEDHVRAPSYLEMLATLRPIDLYALIDTLRISSPIVGEVLKSFVKPWQERRTQLGAQQAILPAKTGKAGGQQSRGAPVPNRSKEYPTAVQSALNDSDRYVAAVNSVLDQLENDYRRSKQTEMVLWSTGEKPRPYGVVDLDLGDYEPEELRAKLSGGTFHVVGKVTRVVPAGQSINLLQKSVLYSALALLNRLVETQGQTEGLAHYQQGIGAARKVVEQFGLLEVPGPAVRVAAMSVCI